MLDSEIVTASKCGFQNGKPIVNALLRMQLNGRRRDGVLACFGAEVSGCLECALFEWARGLCLTPPPAKQRAFLSPKAAWFMRGGGTFTQRHFAPSCLLGGCLACDTADSVCDALWCTKCRNELFSFSSPVTKLKVLQTKISFHGIFFIYTEKSNYFALAE